MSDPVVSAVPDTETLTLLLHEAIDGDFLIDARGLGVPRAIQDCGAADVVRWATTAVLAAGYVSPAELAERDEAVRAAAWDEGWQAAGDAYVAGASAAAACLPMPDSGDGPPNPYRRVVGPSRSDTEGSEEG